MSLPPLLDELLRAHGPTGHEQLAFDVVRRAVEGFAETETDSVGNIVARRSGAGGGPSLAIFSHLDVVGLAVAHVHADGLLAVHMLGVWRAPVAYGQRVEIQGAAGPVNGVVTSRVKEDKEPTWDNLYVDIGATDAEDALRVVAPGDPMTAIAPPLALLNGRVASRSLDNRASVYVALEALRRLDGLAGDVTVVCTAQEETGHDGVRPAMERVRPELAIALDVTYATDQPAGDPAEAGDHRLGGGPAIFRGPAITPGVFDELVATARAEGIPYSVETGMKSYTDADDTFLANGGTPTGLVSIPLRNMHMPVETVQLSDVEHTIDLLVAFARGLKPGVSYAR
jgi:putative aminopeptidase FrvX